MAEQTTAIVCVIAVGIQDNRDQSQALHTEKLRTKWRQLQHEQADLTHLLPSDVKVSCIDSIDKSCDCQRPRKHIPGDLNSDATGVASKRVCTRESSQSDRCDISFQHSNSNRGALIGCDGDRNSNSSAINSNSDFMNSTSGCHGDKSLPAVVVNSTSGCHGDKCLPAVVMNSTSSGCHGDKSLPAVVMKQGENDNQSNPKSS